MNIGTERLSLRPLAKASPKQVAWLRDPDVVKYSEQRHRNHTLSSQLRWVQSFAGRSVLWGIYRIDSGEQIGNLTAMVDEPNNVADVGIMIGDKASWRKGFGSEAWSAACTWLLHPDGGKVRKLEAGCMRENEGMLAILQKTRFVYEGERANHFLLNHNPVGAVLYGRFR
jgi:[ribosomal protein S5]-alanine N-acetyltransferase